MDPARGTPGTGTKRGRTTILGLASTLVGAGAAVVVLAAPAIAAPSSTTINPAGDRFTASLASGSADFTTGNVTVSCNRSSTSGQVPAAPGNHNAAGPVSVPVSPPTFTNSPSPCTTNQFFVTASAASSGSWAIEIQFDPAGSTGTLDVPQGGVVVTTSGLASCTVTVAPDGPIRIAGALSDNTPALPTLTFTAVPVPISVTGGFGCPTAQTSGTFSATYQIADTTNSNALFTVTS